MAKIEKVWMNKTRERRKSPRQPRAFAGKSPEETSWPPPSDWGLRLQRALRERDQLLATHKRLISQSAGLVTDRRNESKLAANELLTTFGQYRTTCHYFTDLFEFAPVGYAVLDQKGQIQEINQTAAQLLGRDRLLLLRQFLLGFVVREDVGKLLDHLHRCKQRVETVSTELRIRRKDRRILPVELLSAPFENPVVQVTQFRTVIIDSTERRKAEEALRLVQEDYHSLVDSIQGVVWEASVQAPEWRFIFVSKQAKQLLGYDTQRWVVDGEFWQHRLHPEDRSWVLSARARAVTAGKDHMLEYRMIDAERRTIWVRDSVTIEGGGCKMRLKGILINITELKMMEEALRRANNELEGRVEQRTADLARTCDELQREICERQRLEQELLDLTEKGRHRQGVDAHDDIGQTLAGITFLLKSLGSKLEKTAPKEADQAGRIRSIVDQKIAQTDPAQAMVSSEPQEQSLPVALKGLAARAETVLHVPCVFKPNGGVPSLDQDVVTQFYNIAQEAVVNSVKYGEAGRVVLALSRKNGRVTLTVEHNGHAFATPLHHSLELGLKIMHFRAKLIGADLQIAERSVNGPLVTCTLPGSSRVARAAI